MKTVDPLVNNQPLEISDGVCLSDRHYEPLVKVVPINKAGQGYIAF